MRVRGELRVVDMRVEERVVDLYVCTHRGRDEGTRAVVRRGQKRGTEKGGRAASDGEPGELLIAY